MHCLPVAPKQTHLLSLTLIHLNQVGHTGYRTAKWEKERSIMIRLVTYTLPRKSCVIWARIQRLSIITHAIKNLILTTAGIYVYAF